MLAFEEPKSQEIEAGSAVLCLSYCGEILIDHEFSVGLKAAWGRRCSQLLQWHIQPPLAPLSHKDHDWMSGLLRKKNLRMESACRARLDILESPFTFPHRRVYRKSRRIKKLIGVKLDHAGPQLHVIMRATRAQNHRQLVFTKLQLVQIMKSSKQLQTKSSFKNSQPDEDIEGDEPEHEETVIGLINALLEIQKKNGKSTGRSDFQKRKLEQYNAAREQSMAMVKDASALINDIKTRMEDLKRQHNAARNTLPDLPSMIARRDECKRALQRELPKLIDKVSPRRSQEVNDASATLESFTKKREQSRRRIIRYTREYLDEGLEQQRLAVDATEMIKHYKALLRS